MLIFQTQKMVKSFQSVYLVTIIALATALNSVIGATTICPTPEFIHPCTCREILPNGNVACEGPQITNLDVSRTFRAIRAANNASSTEILNINTMFLTTTDLTEFDLSPFFNFRFSSLDFFNNKNLERLFVPAGSNGLIEAEWFGLDINPKLNAVGLGNTFSYFEKNTTKSFSFYNNGLESTWVNLTDGSGDIEFLRGLSSFPNLNQLIWTLNSIQKLSGGQFKRMQGLNHAILTHNTLSELGENDLLIQNERGGKIIFSYNNLNDEKMHANSGLTTLKGGWLVDLQGNKFEYISEEKFGRFLSAHPENKLVFALNENTAQLNPFICDQRMKWLKDAAGVDVTLPLRATGIYCSNDPGYTIFTTQLV